MRRKNSVPCRQFTFRRFSGKGWAVFSSLSLNVRIGMLSVATLAYAAPAKSHAWILAQNHAADDDKALVDDVRDESELDELTVSASMAPLTQLQSARIVSVLTRQDIQQSGAQSVNDLLKTVSGVDVRQRGAFGVQTDIGIDGGQFDQVIILLNGVNVSNPHTGHLAMDLPVSIADIERIEVLEGAAARVYAGCSFSGAVNIVTRRDSDKSVEFAAEGGSFGSVTTDARLNLTHKSVGTRLSGGWGRSDGGTVNSDWNMARAYYQGNYTKGETDVCWQLGYSHKDYGANTFYSAAYPNQFEANRRILVSVAARTGGLLHLSPEVYWNRTYDHFQLIRDESFGENFHRVDVYGLKLNGYVDWKLGKTAFGAALRHEGIYSTSLGRDLEEAQWVGVPGQDELYYKRHDQRTNINFNLEHNLLLERWTVSAGVTAHLCTGVDYKVRFAPGVDVSYRPSSSWKLFASYNVGYRLPSFTELYYKSPTHDGNRDLKPETSHNFQIAAKYYRRGVDITAKTFYHLGRDMIDWVMYSAQDQFHSTNFQLDNLGVGLDARIDFPQLCGKDTWLTDASVSYTYMKQWRHDDIPVFKSNYAMEYLRHKFTASLSHKIWSRLSATWQLRVQDRNGGYILYEGTTNTGELVPYSSYATLDAKLQWTAPRYDVWLNATNITDTHYYDYGNIPQPGVWFMAGARIKFNL